MAALFSRFLILDKQNNSVVELGNVDNSIMF